MLGVRAREEVKEGSLVIGMKMRRAKKPEPRELSARERLRDGGE